MLQDHFHPPLSDRFGWKGFHTQWAAVLTADLNLRLPTGWRASAEVELGIEIDVGVVDENGGLPSGDYSDDVLAGYPPTLAAPFSPTVDVIEVQIVNPEYSPGLVGAIELVSPADKDRPDHRRSFVNKCAALLGTGAGLVVVDIVTCRRANLHQQLLNLLRIDTPQPIETPCATSYFPARTSEETTSLQVWEEPLELARCLPTLPLCLRVGPTMIIDLDATYRKTCEELRIPLPSSTTADPPNTAAQ